MRSLYATVVIHFCYAAITIFTVMCSRGFVSFAFVAQYSLFLLRRNFLFLATQFSLFRKSFQVRSLAQRMSNKHMCPIHLPNHKGRSQDRKGKLWRKSKG